MVQTYDESQFIYHLEQEFSKRIKPALYRLGGERINGPKFLSRSDKLPHQILMGWKNKDRRHKFKTLLSFESFGYSGGKTTEGKPTIYEKATLDGGWERTIKADLNGDGVEQEINESHKVINEESEAWNVNAKFEVTNRTSIKAEASFGDIAGASAESETTTTASSEFGTGKTFYKSEERTFDVKTTLKAKPGQTVQGTVEILEKKIVTPIVQEGLIDFEVVIDMYDWAGEQRGRHYLKNSIAGKHKILKFDSRRALIRFLEGKDERQYPNMKDFYRDIRNAKPGNTAHGSMQFLKWLRDDRNFTVKLEKERVQVFRNAGTLKQTVLQDDSKKG